ncbi:MAG TPA: nitric-oxide reductase large subunit [candidate division Zixibacteria bacterium]|nr:nitric-oxide reductase large subunit [candidate division Zixibacteria bacterium]
MANDVLSPWWRHAVILTIAAGFTILIWLSAKAYRDAPPIPERVAGPSGETLFTREDILAGQSLFTKYGLMDNGTIWGHGAYLGPDFSAAYLHALALGANEVLARERFGGPLAELSPAARGAVGAETAQLLKENRYDPRYRTLRYTHAEALSYRSQIQRWAAYFSEPRNTRGLPAKYIGDPGEIRQLTAFFAWTAWASVANRPGKPYSYTNNFPYEPIAGNTPTGDALLWSALSLVALLAGIAAVLFAFGKFDYLGWKGKGEHIHPQMLPGTISESQKAVIKYFFVAALLFLAQVLVGGATAHYRADPVGFYGIDLSRWLPSHLARTWHLQLGVLWVATAYVAGGLFLAPALGKDPAGQARGVDLLFGALLVVAAGSLLGELLGLNQAVGDLWFWFGHQGWEYLELGRAWQILLAAALIYWLVLLFRALAPSRRDPERREIASLFLYAAAAIPLFYLPAMFFDDRTHFTVVDMWRFWIIHLWVEGFFELFATVMVAIIFYQLGAVSRATAARVVYLDAILYLGSGIVGTGHHWYWTGQSNVTMAFAAMFSALEVVPLTLLTLDAWDFVRLSRGRCDVCNKAIAVPHKWTFYFLMAVGFWNFVGAGVFGFLINLPIVSYFEVGTMLTPNHGHAAMMGVFGMLAIALLTFALRQVLGDGRWATVEKLIGVSFWGLNLGLGLMVLINLFPGGVLQLADVLEHGYWHARSPEFLDQPLVRYIEWARLPADAVFIAAGVVPMLIASGWTLLAMRRPSAPPTGAE